MATRFPYPGLLVLCSLVLPAAAVAQDATISAGQDQTRTQTSSSSQTTTTTTTGRSQEISRSDSSGVELDGYHGEDGDDLDGDRRHGRMPSREGDLFGDWTLGQENGNSCTITLKDSPWFGGYGAWVPAGCPDGFFAVNRWLLSGNQLLLTDTNNQVIGRFRSSGGGGWSGHRESDGARLYLNPARR